MASVENTERDDLTPIVPADFEPPLELRTANTVLRPLGPEHNAADLLAWTSSIDHIKATPGFGPPRTWPPQEGLSEEQNLKDLEIHRRHFEQRVGFTYTILNPALDRRVDSQTSDLVLGCLYVYGPRSGSLVGSQDRGYPADVRSWVVADRPELDREIWTAVSRWLETSWPFTSVDYAPRTG